MPRFHFALALLISGMVLTSIPTPGFARADRPATETNDTYIRAMARVFGYCEGQAMSVTKAKQAFPDMSAAFDRAVILFDVTTRKSCPRVEERLTEYFGAAGVAQLRQQFVENIGPTLAFDRRDVAQTFLTEVQARSEWVIESPVREILLSLTYQSRPEQEFLDRHTTRFEGDGSGKMKGLSYSLSAPQSWLLKDGDRPNIAQKWVSRAGTGFSYMLTAVYKDDFRSEPDNWAELLRQTGEDRDIAPEGATFVESEAFQLEGRSGLRIRYTMNHGRLDQDMFTILDQYMLLADDTHMMMIMCSTVMPADLEGHARAEFEGNRFLCKQVVNSLVLPALYEPSWKDRKKRKMD